MKKITLPLASILFAGMVGFASANGNINEPLAQPNRAARLVGLQQACPRFELKDRIRNQRERIEQDLKDQTITPDKARVCRAVLNVVEKWVNREAALNGANRMTEKQYEAGNRTLDMNSKMIHEPSHAYFYYDSCRIGHWLGV